MLSEKQILKCAPVCSAHLMYKDDVTNSNTGYHVCCCTELHTPKHLFVVGYFGTILHALVYSGKVKQLLGCLGLDNHHYQQLPHLHHSLMALQQIKIGMLGQRQKTGVLRILVVTGVILTPQPQLGSGKVTKLIEATLGQCFSTMLQFLKNTKFK